jgi:hypothetical protein
MWSTLLSAILVINEVMASNTGEVMSPAINFDSWIEVYNPGETAVNLGGMFLSVDPSNPYLWQMPSDMGSVPKNGFKVIWLGSNDIKSNQAPFKLDCDGGTIILSDKNGELITKQNYPEAMSRTAYARKTDGGDEWGWTATPTPEATNTTAVFAKDRLKAPVVDQGSQLFKSSLTIKVDIPEGTTLRFTTDGSVPTASSAISTKGQFTISKTTNYVFRLFQDGYLPSVPVTRSYIKTDNQYTIPIISIVGNEKYFTDPKIGIDCDGDGTNGKTGNGQDQKRNYNCDWDRPVNFSYLSPDGQMLFNQDVNIAVSGGWTRSIFPRSMKLKSNKIFDGQNRFDFSFFPQKPYIRNKQLVIRNGGNDIWNNNSRFRDAALETIIQRSGIDLDCQSYVPVIEYVNGELRGVLNLREPNNDKYAYANFGYDDEELDAFENKEFKNGNDEAYKRLIKLSEDINGPGIYEEVRTLLDIDEFANYMAAEFYLGNDDWPDNNVKAYRSQLDGRFRFMSFDLDYTFNPWGRTISSSLSDYGINGREKPIDVVILFINLLKHDGFRKQFIDTFCLMGGSVFEEQRANSIIDELLANVKPMTDLMRRSPNNLDRGHHTEEAANAIKSQLSNRLSKMISALQQASPMKLSGVKKHTVTLGADAECASLYINGLQVPYAYFNGQLFSPVKIEAKAPVGYTFAGWKQKATATNQIVKLNDTWKYYDKGAAPNDWTATSFNDNSWASGQAPLGYGMTGLKTTVGYGSDAENKHPTTYFRKTIKLDSDPTRSDIFILNYQIDDGFIVYVNGREAGRFQMPSGNVTFNTFASSYAGDDPISGSLNISSSLFKRGDNVIAVEIHNNKASSRDIFWAAEVFTTMGSTSGEFVSTEPVINLTSSDNTVSFVACFTPLSDAERAAQGVTPVRINEVSAQNSIYVNEQFKRNDWLELYNTTGSPIDVEGMYLTNSPKNPKKYKITKGNTQTETIIPAHGYLVIWCDGLETASQMHANFKLDNNKGDLVLTAADESWSDQFTYTRHNGDQTVGRYPDGAAEVYVMNIPTIAKSNIKTSYLVSVEQPNATAIQGVRTTVTNTDNATYNLAGQRVDENYKGIVIRNGRKVMQ